MKALFQFYGSVRSGDGIGIMRKTKIIAVVVLCLVLPVPVEAQQGNNLAYYINSALKNSPVLNDYRNQCYSAKIDSMETVSSYGLKVTGIGDAMSAPVIHGWGYDTALSNGQDVTAVIRVSKELPGRAEMKARMTGSSLLVKQLYNRTEITGKEISRTVTDQYIKTYAAQCEYENSLEIVDLLEKEDTLLRELTRKAVFKQTDYLSFVVALQQNRLISHQLHAGWLEDYSILNHLSGIADTTLEMLAPPSISAGRILPYGQSIYARSYETDSLELENGAKIINCGYRPGLSLYAESGYSSSFMKSPYKNFGADAGLSLTIPIYDGGRRKKLLRQNLLKQDTRQRYNDFRKNQYMQQAADIERRICEYRSMKTEAMEQLHYSHVLIDANLRQLPTGDISITDFIMAIKNHIGLESGIIQINTVLYSLYDRQNNLTL
ncbi:MAG: TolC family protein [Bacteroidales bacterium]|jgi:hypothetical protein|nr:TolC family protein [Bacteroidales bacterium]MCI1785997.1 TolC family protein [Bacteroidales bacterium]